MSTATPGADQLQALISYSNNKTGASDTTLSDAVTRLVTGYGGGGAIEDGIVVKAYNSSGMPTEVDFYDSDGIIHYSQFGCTSQSATWPFKYVEKINLMNDEYVLPSNNVFQNLINLADIDLSKIKEIQGATSSNTSGTQCQFQSCRSLTSLNFPNLIGGLPKYCFQGCSGVTSVYMPKISGLYGYSTNRGCFQGCSALATCEFGSVGYPITYIHDHAFGGCSALATMTFYAKGDYVDTILTRARNDAPDATIIIKAAESTTYNDVSYSAGDTIVTDTPSS